MALLELQNVSYLYGKGTPFEKKALKNINVSFEEGLTIGIIGHTGSGKSTLVQLLNGLNEPTEGKVLFEGNDINSNKKDLRQLRFSVGLVFQYPEYQLFEETVAKDIAFGPKNMGLDDEEISKRIKSSLEFCGLDESVCEKSPFELSGGQKRRVAIAGVMAMSPKVLVLDEPAAGLDPIGRETILGGINEWKEKTNGTVILVSHSMEEIAMRCDRILVLNKGEVFKYGTVNEIFENPEDLEDIGLETPQVTRIFLKLRQMGIDIPKNIYTTKYAKKMILEHLGKDGANG